MIRPNRFKNELWPLRRVKEMKQSIKYKTHKKSIILLLFYYPRGVSLDGVVLWTQDSNAVSAPSNTEVPAGKQNPTDFFYSTSTHI